VVTDSSTQAAALNPRYPTQHSTSVLIKQSNTCSECRRLRAPRPRAKGESPETAHALARESPSISAGLGLLTGSGEEEEEEEEESLFKADAVNEEDSERDRATQV
jgi:hypothetical protein